MPDLRRLRLLLALSAGVAAPLTGAYGEARSVDIPAKDLKAALADFIRQSGAEVIYSSDDMAGLESNAVQGLLEPEEALKRLVPAQGARVWHTKSGAFAIVKMEKTGNKPATPPQADDRIESVLVTGSSIRGASAVGSNIMTFDRHDIEATGASSLQEFISTIPAIAGFGQGWQFGAGTISPSGESQPSIHALGSSSSASTLILLNGRPFTPSGFFGNSDPGVVPMIALQRIDVMPDGDSAIYGSSAVAGVINFVTRPSYEGVFINAQFGQAHKFQDAMIGVLAGHRWSGGSALVAWEYRSNSNLLSMNRGFSASADLRPLGGANFSNFNCSPATIARSSSATDFLFAAPYSNPSIGTTLTAEPHCDSSGDQSIIPVSEQHSVFLDIKQTFADTIELALNAGYNFRMSNARMPLPAFTGTTFGPTGASTAQGTLSRNPFFQGNQETGTSSEFIRWDPNPLLGPSHIKGGVRNLYLNFTATAEIGRDWAAALDYSGGLNESRIRTIDAFCGVCATLALNGTTNAGANMYGGLLRPLNAQNALDVWNPAGSSLTSPYVRTEVKGDTSDQAYRTTMHDVRMKFDGPLFTWRAGDAKAAIGIQLEQVDLEQVQALSNASEAVLPGHQSSRQKLGRNVQSAFAELVLPVVSPEMGIPMIQKLELQIAGRYDDYSDAGNTRNPKLGIDWNVADGVKARGSYSTSFTAPSMIFLQGVSTVSLGDTSFTIPASHPGYASSFCTTVAGPCTVGPNTPFPGIMVFGPNPGLKPMTGQSYTVGVDLLGEELWRPLAGLSVNLTWWRTRFNDAITLVSANGAGYLTTPGLQGYLQIAPPGGWADNTPEISAAVGASALSYPLPQRTYFISNQLRVNGFSLIGDGIDLNAQYVQAIEDVGDIHVGVMSSWKLDWDVKGGPNSAPGEFISYLNGRFDTSVLKAEAFEARFNIGWSNKTWSLDAYWNYTNPYWYQTSTGPFATATTRPAGFPNSLYSGGFQRVAANSTFDLNLSYTLPALSPDDWTANTLIFVNGNNVMNTRPPFFNVGGIGRPSVGYNGNDNFNAAPLQRVITAGFRKSL